MDGWMDGWMDGMDGWMGWMDGWMDRKRKKELNEVLNPSYQVD